MGPILFLAPELLGFSVEDIHKDETGEPTVEPSDQGVEMCGKTLASDIYAFGCVCYQVRPYFCPPKLLTRECAGILGTSTIFSTYHLRCNHICTRKSASTETNNDDGDTVVISPVMLASDPNEAPHDQGHCVLLEGNQHPWSRLTAFFTSHQPDYRARCYSTLKLRSNDRYSFTSILAETAS